MRHGQGQEPPPQRIAAPAVAGQPCGWASSAGSSSINSVWKIPVRGWLSQLDRRLFRLFCYHTAGRVDGETDVARSLSERFVQGPLGSVEAWREEILSDRHVLLYPEIGMDPMSAQLAAIRLAPVQCTSWGHPSTSGYPDDRLFPELGRDGAAGREQGLHRTLVRLPNLSIYYHPVDIPPEAIDREALGLRPDACVYWCGQFPSKYLPQHDRVFARIAREVPGCQFMFIEPGAGGSETNMRFRERRQRAFAAHGLDSASHCVFSGA